MRAAAKLLSAEGLSVVHSDDPMRNRPRSRLKTSRFVNTAISSSSGLSDPFPVENGATGRRSAGGVRPGSSPSNVRVFLESHSDQPAAWTAPPSGLFLERIYYEADKKLDRLEPVMTIMTTLHDEAVPTHDTDTLCIFACIGCDQATKSIAQRELPGSGQSPCWAEWSTFSTPKQRSPSWCRFGPSSNRPVLASHRLRWSGHVGRPHFTLVKGI